MKKCSTCKEVKGLLEFHKNRETRDGLQNVCKVCKHGYHLAKPWLARARNKKYKKLNKEQVNAGGRRRAKNHPEWARRGAAKQRATRSENVRARKLPYKAVKRRELARGVCLVCRVPRAEAHHSDYSKPLEVVWLCRIHHRAWHRIFRIES